MRPVIACAFAALSGMLTAVSAAPSTTTYQVPPGVKEPAHVELPGQTDQDYFWWKVPFPGTPALAHYEKVFENWTRCGEPDQWWRHGRDPGSPLDHFLHKFERQWVSPKNDRAVSLQFRYLSRGPKVTTLPSTEDQMVSVITTRVKDAAAHFEAIGIKCPASPGKPG